MKILELGIAGLAVNQNIDEHLLAMRMASRMVKSTIDNNDILSLVDVNHMFHLAYAACAKNEFLVRACLEVRNQLPYGLQESKQEGSLPINPSPKRKGTP
jgi:DNA-binding FadR family transcriptional regulator